MSSTDWVTLITGLASSCALPIVIIAIAYFFRKPILDSLTSIELGSFKAQFKPSTSGLVPGVKENAEISVEWNRTGALFWFTVDIYNAINAVLFGSDKHTMLDLTSRSLNHAIQLKLDNAIVDALTRIVNDIRDFRESDWTSDKRVSASGELQRVFNTVAELAKAHEDEVCDPPFKPDP